MTLFRVKVMHATPAHVSHTSRRARASVLFEILVYLDRVAFDEGLRVGWKLEVISELTKSK